MGIFRRIKRVEDQLEVVTDLIQLGSMVVTLGNQLRDATEALEAIQRELGEPDEEYPVWVTNAVNIAEAALASIRSQHDEF